jgi:large subunit ribosomal protein L5
MNFYNYYNENVVKYDLLNKFQYKTLNQMPKFCKIILNFGCKKSDLKQLGPTLLALELITSQKSLFTNSSTTNISLKIKKGSPSGCKVTLRKMAMYTFIHKIVNGIFPKLKQFQGFKSLTSRAEIKKTFSFSLKNNLLFLELEKHYQYFNRLPHLDVTMVTDANSFNELVFLLKSFKIPLIGAEKPEKGNY